jgi:hypothetical protein
LYQTTQEIMQRNYIIIALVSFLAGLLVYDVFLVDLYLSTREPKQNEQESDIKFLNCPYVGNFNDFWNTWSYEYLSKYPQSDVNMQMDAWNKWIIERGCSEEWLNPLDDVIKQYGASGTPVYWYESD